MKPPIRLTVFCLGLSLALPGNAFAQTGHAHSDHMSGGAMDHAGGDITMPTEGGQSAFTAIAEIVDILRADPGTDWNRVDIESLRQHLIDMDAVTLRAIVSDQPVTGPDAAMIRSLGFIGVMSLGMHHQAHHIALARGVDPHQD